MPEYIEREKLIKHIRLLPRFAPYNTVRYSSVQNAIFDAPTADATKVVRCKDCEYSGKTSEDEQDYYCQNKYGLNGYICDASYCCNGKRKEGAENAD